jgi:serine kinase of HPr protein (carbohydrate metabolism regulator)
MMAEPVRIHASTVAIGGRAVLLEGPSGAGKSDLALRLIDRGARLVSDDYTALTVRDGTLIADAPSRIAGRIEVRGLGIAELLAAGPTPVALRVQLGPEGERMPERRLAPLSGVAVRQIAIDPFTASAPIRVELALAQDLPA